MLVAFTNIDIVAGPCNNIKRDKYDNLDTRCEQCFLGEKATFSNNFTETTERIKKLKQNYPDASFFFYPAEYYSGMDFTSLMLETGQKAMSNGKKSGIANIIADQGFSQVSFSLYSDWEEMNVFYGYSEVEFNAVIKNIETAVNRRLDVEVFSIVTPLNYNKIPRLYSLSERLGVSKISLLPLEPLGKAKNMDDKYFLDQETLDKVVQVVESIKSENGLKLSMGFGFGLTKSAAQRFYSSQEKSWVKTQAPCPAVNNEYAAVVASEVYFCFKTIDETFGRIGYVDDQGMIILDNKYELTKETIIEKIDGICSQCNILDYCVGGCRSKAIADNLRENPDLSFEDIIYKGQKFCRIYSQTKGDTNAKTI